MYGSNKELEKRLMELSDQLMQQLDEEFISLLRDKLYDQSSGRLTINVFHQFQTDYIVALLLMIIYELKKGAEEN